MTEWDPPSNKTELQYGLLKPIKAALVEIIMPAIPS
jgi:hypothetical protein